MKITYSLTKNLHTEANRVFFILNQVVIQFYQKSRFILLPKKVVGTTSVFLPDLDYKKLSFYPHGLEKDIMFGDEDKSLITELEKFLLKNNVGMSKTVLSEKYLNEFISRFTQIVEGMFGDLPAHIHYDIYETDYGTVASWSEPERLKDGTSVIKIFIRSDVIESNLIEAFFSPFPSYIISSGGFNPEVEKSWLENEQIVDYFLSHTKLKTLSTGYLSTVQDEMCDLDDQLIEESSKFYLSLGFPVKSLFEIEGDSIYYDNKGIDILLTKTELAVFLKLLINKRSLVVYEDLAKVMWGEEWAEKYSLWSIAKVVQKVRNKLIGLGLSKGIILTKRGEGYWVWD